MLRKLSTLAVSGALAALCLAGSGCTVEGQVHTAGYYGGGPGLVMVQPGLYVVADYPQPIFYNSGYYFWYRDGYWLRSPYYNRGWVRVRSVPVTVQRIHRPTAYVHYRATGRPVYYAPTHRGERPRPVQVERRNDRRIESSRRPQVDHRTDVRVQRSRPAQVDHRSDRVERSRPSQADRRSDRRDERHDGDRDRNRDRNRDRDRDRHDRD